MKQKEEEEIKSYTVTVITMFNIFLIIFIFIFLYNYFHLISIKIRGLIFLEKHLLKELKIEFKNPVFLVSLPTNDYKFYTSLPKDFIVNYDVDNFLFPNIVGLKVYHKAQTEKKIIFYCKFSDITLNKTNFKSKNTEKLYIEYLLISKKNKNFIKQEICRQLRERN